MLDVQDYSVHYNNAIRPAMYDGWHVTSLPWPHYFTIYPFSFNYWTLIDLHSCYWARSFGFKYYLSFSQVTIPHFYWGVCPKIGRVTCHLFVCFCLFLWHFSWILELFWEYGILCLSYYFYSYDIIDQSVPQKRIETKRWVVGHIKYIL